MGHPAVHAIVLNHNGRQHNARCLRSLMKQTYPNLRVLFVDNGSDDDSVEAVKREFGNRVDLLLNGQNLFFAAGNNRGMRNALEQGADYLFLVNNDTVLKPDCVAELTECMVAHPGAGGCQPLLCRMDGDAITPEVCSAGIKVSLSGRCWDAGRGKAADAFGTEPVDVAGITGAAMFLPAQVVRQVGFLDEKYIMYFEDADYSFRIRRAGYSLFCAPKARMGHVGSATASILMPEQRLRLCETNSYRLVLGHFPDGQRPRGILASAMFTLGSCLRSLARGRPAAARAIVAGGRDGLKLALKGTNQNSNTGNRERLREYICAKTWYPPGT